MSHGFAQNFTGFESHYFVAGKDVEGNSPSSLKDETPQTPNSISKVLWDRELFPVLFSFHLRMLLIILTLLKRVIEKASPSVSAWLG